MLLSRVLYFKSEVRLTNSGSYLPSLSHWLLTNQRAEKSRSDTNQDREDDSFKQLSGLLLIMHSWFYVCTIIMLRLNYRGQNLLFIKLIWCEGGCTLVPRWCWVSGLKRTRSCQPARAPPPRTWKNQTPPINAFTAHRDSRNLTTTVIYRHYRERKKLYMSSNINLGKILLLNRDHDNRLNHSWSRPSSRTRLSLKITPPWQQLLKQ